MRRLQLFEMGDLDVVPRAFKHQLTEFLAFIHQFPLDRGTPAFVRRMVHRLAAAVRASGARRVVDLCAGGGGPGVPVRRLLAEEGVDVDLVMTDLRPNPRAWARLCARAGPGVRFHPHPVDATAVPPELRGFRTIFNALHHFPPEAARAVLADAARCRQGICVFEGAERSPAGLAAISTFPLLAALSAPLIPPFSPARLFWSWVVPVTPLMVGFDGVVSCLRTYSAEELVEMTRGLGGPGYRWEVERVPVAGTPWRFTLLLGWPEA